MLENKETTVKSYRKIKLSNQNTKKSPEIERVLFSCSGEMGMDNFSCLHSSLCLFYFYFVTCLQKNYGIGALPAEPPLSPQTTQYALGWTTPPPFGRMYFMDEPLHNCLNMF